jgi:AcrR family transcriptional regulator
MPPATPSPAARTDGRVKRRLDAMRRVQAVALQLFEAKGLSAVAVEDVAARAKVGAASIYRNFGTKEGLVLWDDYDPALLTAILARVKTQPPLLAVRDAVVERLAVIYERDRERILRRTRLMLSEPSLLAANASLQESLRGALVDIFRRGRSNLEAEVLSAVAVGVLDACVREWARKGGKLGMDRVFKSGFALVSSL